MAPRFGPPAGAAHHGSPADFAAIFAVRSTRLPLPLAAPWSLPPGAQPPHTHTRLLQSWCHRCSHCLRAAYPRLFFPQWNPPNVKRAPRILHAAVNWLGHLQAGLTQQGFDSRFWEASMPALRCAARHSSLVLGPPAAAPGTRPDEMPSVSLHSAKLLVCWCAKASDAAYVQLQTQVGPERRRAASAVSLIKPVKTVHSVRSAQLPAWHGCVAKVGEAGAACGCATRRQGSISAPLGVTRLGVTRQNKRRAAKNGGCGGAGEWAIITAAAGGDRHS